MLAVIRHGGQRRGRVAGSRRCAARHGPLHGTTSLHDDDEIAGRLAISPLTAKTHASRAMTKLGARDRAQVVMIACECGLAYPGEHA